MSSGEESNCDQSRIEYPMKKGEGEGLAGDARANMVAFCRKSTLNSCGITWRIPGLYIGLKNVNRRGIQQSPDSRKIWSELLNQEPGRISRIDVDALEP